MDNISLSLSQRPENTRDPIPTKTVVNFSLDEIKQHFDESLEYIKNQTPIARELINQSKETEGKNVLRSQIVFIESILDFYLHELSKYAISSMFVGRWEKSLKYQNLMVSMKYIEKGIAAPESVQWLTEYLNERFSKEVYLGFEQMKDQVNLMGISFKDVLSSAFSSYETGKQFVVNLFQRRNQIAHQIDRKHETAIQEDINENYVDNCINEVYNLVSCIHNAAVTKENSL